jgi:hypothetical protein
VGNITVGVLKLLGPFTVIQYNYCVSQMRKLRVRNVHLISDTTKTKSVLLFLTGLFEANIDPS